MATVQVIGSEDFQSIYFTFKDILPLHDLLWATRPEPGLVSDYMIFLLDKDSAGALIREMADSFKLMPHGVIVCCLDDESYDEFLWSRDKAFTWWVMNPQQASELIAMNAKPFVIGDEIEV